MAPDGISSSAYSEIKQGKSGLLTIAIDFMATGRLEAGFQDLIPNTRLDDTVWHTLPMLAHEGCNLGGSYIDRWGAEVDAADLPVRAILGYCAGSIFAPALSERISNRHDGAPKVIVFDPELPDARSMLWNYHKLVGSLSSVLPEGDIEQAQAAGLEAIEQCKGMPDLADRLIALFSEIGQSAFAHMGLDSRRRSELISTYRSFQSYLVAASEMFHEEIWSTSIVISSGSPDNGLNRLGERVRASAAKEYTFDTTHNDLLRGKDVARLVDALLADECLQE